MKTTNKEVFLYAVTGLSPAVFTETIWGLAAQNPPVLPTCIRIFTTKVGKDKLSAWAKLHWEDMSRAIAKKHKNRDIPEIFKGKWQSGFVEVLKNRDKSGIEYDMDDIRSQDDNLEMAEFMFKKIKEDIDYEIFKGRERPVIYASIAGGRKTMGAMLHSIVSLLGKDGDKIFHVLTDKDPPRDFAYPGCKMESKANIKLDLAEVPFVPLYDILKKNKLDRYTYKTLIRDLSVSINKNAYKIKMQARDLKMIIEADGDIKEISLRYAEFLMAATFLRRAKEMRGKRSDKIENNENYNFKKAPKEESEFEKDLRAEYKRAKPKIKATEPLNMEECDIKQIKGDLRQKIKKLNKYILLDALVPPRKTFSEISPENIEFLDY